MADVKKFVDIIALQEHTKLAKASDERVLSDAKAYAEGLGVNYDVAGASATAKAEAIADAEAKIKAVSDVVATKADQSNLEAEVTRATTKENEIVASVDAIDDKVAANTENIAKKADASALTEEVTRAKNREDEIAGLVSALDEKVGEIPVDEAGSPVAESVVAYVDKKTEGIASDAVVSGLSERVGAAEKAIDDIEADYLKKADKEELQGEINAVDGKADEVAGKVTTLVGEDANKSVRTIANEELAKQLIAEGAKESLDTLGEIAAWIQSHPDDASAMNKAIGDLEALVGTLPEGVTATTIVAYIQEVVNAEKSRAEGVEAGLDERLQAVEGQLGTGEGSVDEKIASAKQEAIDAAATDATSKANAAEKNAKDYADAEFVKDRARLEALEAVDHDHANKAELDLIETGDKAKWDAAAQKAHEHANATELAKIVDGDVAKWNAAEQNAKTYAKGLDDATNAKVDAIDGRVGTVEGAVATKAEASVVAGIDERLTTAEGKITANEAAIASFVAVTPEEVTAMWA